MDNINLDEHNVAYDHDTGMYTMTYGNETVIVDEEQYKRLMNIRRLGREKREEIIQDKRVNRLRKMWER